MASTTVTVQIDIYAVRRMLAEIASDPAVWGVIADRIGTGDAEWYDLSDSSLALDIAQIVCQALAKALSA